MAGVALIALGVVALLTGLWLRRRSWRAGNQAASRQDRTSRALVAYGLACMTTAPLVVASVGCAALSYYLGSTAGQAAGTHASRRATTVMVEGAVAAAVLCGLVVLCEARGILPLQ